MEYKAKNAYRQHSVAMGYDQARFSSLPGRFTDMLEKRALQKAVQASGIKPPSRILDLPCGTGRIALLLAGMGYRVTGVDISQAMVDTALAGIKEHQLSSLVQFFPGNGEALDFEDDTFDLVISLRLFGHLPPVVRRQVVKELARVSRGIVITAFYLQGMLQERLRKKKRRELGVEWHPVTLACLDEELAAAGLQRVKVFFLIPFISETVVILSVRNTG